MVAQPACGQRTQEETEEDVSIASEAASHTTVCSNRIRQTGSDCGLTWEQTLKGALRGDTEAEHRPGGGCELSDNRDRV